MGASHRTIVPPRGRRRTASLPPIISARYRMKRKPRPPRAARALGQAAAIVDDLQGQEAVPAPQPDLDRAGAAVAEGIGHGLLGDPEKVGGGGVFLDQHRFRAIQTAIDPIEFAGGGGEVREAGHEAIGRGIDRQEAAGDLPRLHLGVIEQGDDPRRRLGLRRILGRPGPCGAGARGK